MRRPRHLEGELVTSRRGVFWVGDETVSLPQGTVPRGQMFVQWEAPATVTKPYSTARISSTSYVTERDKNR